MRKEAFSAIIKERYQLNPGSEKEIYHLVLSLEGSNVRYAVGDCLGIYPHNEPSLVQKLLSMWNATGNEAVEDRQGTVHSLNVFLNQRANLAHISHIFSEKEIFPNLKAFCKSLPPILPRFYSIASSMQVVGEEAHLTIGLIDGLCTHYLCKRSSVGEPISVFHQPAHHFSLPPESLDKPIIMIGPGTGIAPFRGFMQERIAQGAYSKNWLFSGERHSKTDCLYQKDWEILVKKGKLQCDFAFSRDQPEKIYVQHKMLQKSQELWEWIEEGAYIFVCGNASHMAKDVEKTLLLIAQNEGRMSTEDAKKIFKELRKENRYQRDIY